MLWIKSFQFRPQGDQFRPVIAVRQFQQQIQLLQAGIPLLPNDVISLIHQFDLLKFLVRPASLSRRWYQPF